MILSILNREVEIIVSISEAQYGKLGGKDMKAQKGLVHDFYIEDLHCWTLALV